VDRHWCAGAARRLYIPVVARHAGRIGGWARRLPDAGGQGSGGSEGSRLDGGLRNLSPAPDSSRPTGRLDGVRADDGSRAADLSCLFHARGTRSRPTPCRTHRRMHARAISTLAGASATPGRRNVISAKVTIARREAVIAEVIITIAKHEARDLPGGPIAPSTCWRACRLVLAAPGPSAFTVRASTHKRGHCSDVRSWGELDTPGWRE
jgi:hypothetical protein